MSCGKSIRPSSASRKLDSLQSTPVTAEFPLNRNVPGNNTVPQTTDSNRIRHNAGVTLVELMVVVTIVATLMMIGIPSYKYVTTSSRVSGEINSLLADMELARSEAVKEGSPITICASSNGTSCSGSASGTNGWNKGWIVFSDFNGNATYDSTADALIKVAPAFNSTDTITAAGTQAVSAITFNREGFAQFNLSGTFSTSDQTQAGVTLKLNLTPVNQLWERCLNITWVGAMATQRGNDAGTSCT